MATEAHLRCNRRWQHNNPEKFKMIYTAYRINNIEEVREKDRKRKMFVCQCKIFRNILLEQN